MFFDQLLADVDELKRRLAGLIGGQVQDSYNPTTPASQTNPPPRAEVVQNLFNMALQPLQSKGDQWYDSPMLPLAMSLMGLGAAMQAPRHQRGSAAAGIPMQAVSNWLALQARGREKAALEETRRMNTLTALAKLFPSQSTVQYQQLPDGSYVVTYGDKVQVVKGDKPTPFSFFASGDPEKQKIAQEWITRESLKMNTPFGMFATGLATGDENLSNLGQHFFQMMHQGFKPMPFFNDQGQIEFIVPRPGTKLPQGYKPIITDPTQLLMWELLNRNNLFAPGGSAPALPQPPKTAGQGEPAPPVSMLKEGVKTKFANGQVWTLVNGKPVRIQ